MSKTHKTTREEWLNNAIEALWPALEEAGAKRAKIHASIGFPSSRGLSLKNRTLGQCWSAKCSADGAAQIFIHPAINDGARVLDILGHEMIHAATPGAGHKGAFVTIARAWGLDGKPTHTTASPELAATLLKLLGKLGDYPQPEFNPGVEEKKQSTRLIKVECPECGYVVRTTAKWIEIGFPTCPCGAEMVEG